MTHSVASQGGESPPGAGLPTGTARSPGVILISVLLILIGVGAVAFLLASVSQNAAVQEVLHWSEPAATTGSETPQPSLLLVFLDQFGIILPVLLIVLGVLFIRLGRQVYAKHITAARWAQTSLVWLAIGLGIFSLLTFFTGGQVATADGEVFEIGAALAAVLPLVALLVVVIGATYLLTRLLETDFPGNEPLGAGETRAAWNLLVPTLAVILIVAARPLEQTFINSLTDKRFASGDVPQFVGLDNYRNLLSIRFDTVECRRDDATGECETRPNGDLRWESIDRDIMREGYRTVWNLNTTILTGPETSLALSALDDEWIESVWVTMVFAFFSVVLELVLGLFIALVVNFNFRGRGLMRMVMLVPWVIPTVISARLWELIFKDTSAGIINKVLMDLGLLAQPEAWLSNPALQVPSAIMVDVWKTTPFMALLLLAGLQTIPGDLYEAASVDGASKIRQFFSITLPLMRPTIAVALVFRTLDALRVFDLFNVLFGRQQLTMATYNYETLVNNQQDGYASAVGVLIFFAIFIFAMIYVRMLGVRTEQ